MESGPEHRVLLSLAGLLLEDGAWEGTTPEVRAAATEVLLGMVRLDAKSNISLNQLRLHTSLTLSPRTAIQYDITNPTPRWQLIRDYLGPEASLRLALALAETLERFTTRSRSSVFVDLAEVRATTPRCELCRL